MSKNTVNILSYLTALTCKFIKGLYYSLLALIRLIKQVFRYIYDASDIFVQTMIHYLRTAINRYKNKQEKNRAIHLTKYILTLSLISVILIIIVVDCFFVVSIGQEAIVLRLGKSNRVLGPGLGFHFPLIERYYIVESELIREEQFGFRQGPSELTKIRPSVAPQEHHILENYEKNILYTEEDSNSFFSSKGDIYNEVKKSQRMTHDYLRKHYAPPKIMSKEAIDKRIKVTESLLNKYPNSKNTMDGKILIPSELKMLTGSLNIVELQWTIQYTIKDVKSYLFNSRDSQRNLRDIALAKMNETIGNYTVQQIITNKRNEIEKNTLQKVQKIVSQYQLGININRVIILLALPAKETIPAFNEVNKASQEMERLVYEAQRAYESQIPAIKGYADKIILDAKAYARYTIQKAYGEAERFNLILQEYKKAKQVTKDRLYIEAMEFIYYRTPHIVVGKDIKGIVPVLMGKAVNKMLKNIVPNDKIYLNKHPNNALQKKSFQPLKLDQLSQEHSKREKTHQQYNNYLEQQNSSMSAQLKNDNFREGKK